MEEKREVKKMQKRTWLRKGPEHSLSLNRGVRHSGTITQTGPLFMREEGTHPSWSGIWVPPP